MNLMINENSESHLKLPQIGTESQGPGAEDMRESKMSYDNVMSLNLSPRAISIGEHHHSNLMKHH